MAYGVSRRQWTDLASTVGNRPTVAASYRTPDIFLAEYSRSFMWCCARRLAIAIRRRSHDHHT